MANPTEILDLTLDSALGHLENPFIEDSELLARVMFVCRNQQNRAGVRLLMACSLAKIDRPEIDIRKPYTEIGDNDAYSGRSYDETYISTFINEHDLPCNSTTAFLTPALRNRNTVLAPDINLMGRPPKVYEDSLQLIADVHAGSISAQTLLNEVVRCLLIYRDERRERMEGLLRGLRREDDSIPLSAEAIVTLIQQHLSSPYSSRLPVLVVAAAYIAAESHLGERMLPLNEHNAADSQTGALGDIEITLRDDDGIITSYEMKTRRVTINDIDLAIAKMNNGDAPIENYIFITTDIIDDEVADYASSIYNLSGGIEVVVLNCIGFLRHFLHLFHRLRLNFLDAYQTILLDEPDSAVRQELKEAFLALRQATESGE